MCRQSRLQQQDINHDKKRCWYLEDLDGHESDEADRDRGVWSRNVLSPNLAPSRVVVSEVSPQTRSNNSPKKLATPEGNSQLDSNCLNSKAPGNSGKTLAFALPMLLRTDTRGGC